MHAHHLGIRVRDDRGQWLTAVMVAVLVVLMTVPEGFVYADLENARAPASGSAVSRLLWLSMLGIGALMLLRRARFAWLLLVQSSGALPGLLLAFFALVAISVNWSIEPTVTLRRLVRVLTIGLVTLVPVLIGWHLARFQSLLRPVITALLLASIVFALGWPQLGVHGVESGKLVGAWRGLSTHKNALGDIACIGLILWAHAWLARETSTARALLGGGVALTCLLLSRSSTSLLATGLALIGLLLLLRTPAMLQRWMPQLTIAFVIGLVVYSLALLDLVPGLDLLLTPVNMLTGKDSTFTGRSEIWTLITEHVAVQPWLGSGYGAYWNGPLPGTPSYTFIERMAFYPGSAHNGYLEILNDLGTVGLVLLLAYLLCFLRQSLALLAVDRRQGALYLVLFVQQAVTNLSESRWLNALNVDFVIMSLATFGLARSLLDVRLAARSATPPQPGPMPMARLAGDRALR